MGGFLAVEDGAAGAADGYAVLDFFRADRAIGQRPRIVEPRLLEAELARGAALEVGDEHGVVGALPFEVGGGYQALVKLLQTLPSDGEFTVGWRLACGYEYAVIASLSGVAIDFASDVFGDFARGDAIFQGALVAPNPSRPCIRESA